MYRGFNSTWEERLRDLLERSKIPRVSEYSKGMRHYPMQNHMQWAQSNFLALNEVWMITDWLVDVEREIHRETGISRSDALYYSRRFEYPWAFMRLPQRRGCRILDAGGGNATFQFLLSLLHGEVVNMDLNTEFLGEVEKIKSATRLFNNLKTVEGDITRTSYPDNYFDASVCISALEHGSHGDVSRGITELRRITRGPIAVTMDVTQEGYLDKECVDKYVLRQSLEKYRIDLNSVPYDIMLMRTVRNIPFMIACIYLHGDELG